MYKTSGFIIVLFFSRQVLSLMVESLTQFFEENGLANGTSHAVLDEQIQSKPCILFSLYETFGRNVL
jgi:hypothetical protein